MVLGKLDIHMQNDEIRSLINTYTESNSKWIIDQWNKTESSEINPCLCGQSNLTKEARICNGIKAVTSVNGVGKIGQVREKKGETRPPTHTIHKNKLKMERRLKCMLQTIKILEKNIGSKISDTSCSNVWKK